MDRHPGLRQILADLSTAQGALTRSSTAFDAAIEGMHEALRGIAAAHHAQGEAMAAVAAATAQALLHLFTANELH